MTTAEKVHKELLMVQEVRLHMAFEATGEPRSDMPQGARYEYRLAMDHLTTAMALLENAKHRCT